MKEQIINRVCTKLSATENTQTIENVKKALSIVLDDYIVSQKEEHLVLYEEYIPETVKIFLVARKIEGMSEHTIYNYSLYLQEFFWCIRKPLDKIETNDVRLYLYKMKEQRNLQNSSVELRRVVLNSFFNWCVQNEYLEKNVMQSIKPIKCEDKCRKPLTEIELEKIRNSCKNLRDKAIIEFLNSTACRVSELVDLNRESIDLNSGEIIVRGKGNKQRTVYLNLRAKLALFDYLNSRTDNNEALFVALKYPYDRIHKHGIERVVREVGKSVGFEHNLYPHLFRHTTATFALQRGMPVVEIQKMLGHAKTDTTMVYAKVDKTAVKTDHAKYIM